MTDKTIRRVNIVWQGDMRFVGGAPDGPTIPIDADNGIAPGPMQTLLIAAATCTGADVVSILNTTANQTGHAIETMLIMIAVYLTLSLEVASAMNAYNRRLLRPGA